MAENRADEALLDILSLVALWKDELYAVILGDVVVNRCIGCLDEPSMLRVPAQDADGAARSRGE
jgi:hypothetical protein